MLGYKALSLSTGMWQYILDFLSFAAVITNAFLIAYVSKWGIRNFGVTGTQLWAVLVFEVSRFSQVTGCSDLKATLLITVYITRYFLSYVYRS